MSSIKIWGERPDSNSLKNPLFCVSTQRFIDGVDVHIQALSLSVGSGTRAECCMICYEKLLVLNESLERTCKYHDSLSPLTAHYELVALYILHCICLS